MGYLHNLNQPIDIVTLIEELHRTHKIDDAGNETYIASLSGYQSYSAHYKHYAEVIKETSVRRKVIGESARASELVWSNAEHTTLEHLQTIISHFIELQNELITGRGLSTAEAVNDRIEEALTVKGHRGFNTGIPLLDKWTNGLQPSSLTLLAAAPSMGKSDAMMNWALNISKTKPVLILSLETDILKMLIRMTAMISNEDSMQIAGGETLDGIGAFRADGYFGTRRLWIDDGSSLSATEAREKVKLFTAAHGSGVIFIDHLQLMTTHTSFRSDDKNDTAVTSELKRIAKDFDCAIVVLNHITKEGMKNARPKLQDLKYAGAGDADLAIFLWRSDYQNEVVGCSRLEYIVRKNRAGKNGTIIVQYFPTTGIQVESTDQSQKGDPLPETE